MDVSISEAPSFLPVHPMNPTNEIDSTVPTVHGYPEFEYWARYYYGLGYASSSSWGVNGSSSFMGVNGRDAGEKRDQKRDKLKEKRAGIPRKRGRPKRV